jgi:oligopeptide transport system ATP-binding protein
MEEKILEIRNLHTSFFTHLGEVQAVRDVSFTVGKGKVLGIVGESGSGKSVTALSCMRLLQEPGRIVSGEILFKGKNLREMNKKEMRSIRGNDISMIFQNPMSSMNAVLRVGDQIMEPLLEHSSISKKEAVRKAADLLNLVQIPEAEKRLKAYPHEFSGGMRQRAMIAMALACDPELLIADEPTTALDVTIQSQIIKLLSDIKEKLGMAIILITHDLGVVAEICDSVVVMYGSMIMEEASVDDIYHNPCHPYTLGLLNSIPIVTGDSKNSRLEPIPGTPPNLLKPPPGCPFAPRCAHAMKVCTEKTPEYTYLSDSHRSMCWLLHKDAPDNFLKKGNGIG